MPRESITFDVIDVSKFPYSEEILSTVPLVDSASATKGTKIKSKANRVFICLPVCCD